MDYLISDMWDYFTSTVAVTLEYKALVALGLLLGILVLAVPGRKLSDRAAFAALAAYLSLVFASTVLFRPEVVAGAHTDLFWSYTAALHGDSSAALQILENIVLFAPAGLALGYLCRRSGAWENLLALAGGTLFSFAIEYLQLIYDVGYCDCDDIVSNIIGLLIGFIVVRAVCRVFGIKHESDS